ncbi:hypothetical protein [Burkholderia gladioli]|uniref:hypothetical protein n=1 Tax=Burkholderia gladioli TaxID=28095 RepID=UPI001FC7F899|nr:hypothetical protein [Burkholderia gladioli]
MTNNEKIPAQGGEMPPVERAAITGSGGIDTVRGAAPAGNAAQDRNTNAADVDRDIAHLIDCSEGGIARVPRETLVCLRALLTSPRAAAVPASAGWKLVPIEPTDEMVEAGHAEYERALIGNRKDIGAAFLRRWAAMLDAAPATPVAQPRAHDGLTEQFIDETARLANDAPGIREAVESALQSCSAQIVPVAAQAVAADGEAQDDIEGIARAAGCTNVDLIGDRAKAIERLTAFAVRVRAAVSPATATFETVTMPHKWDETGERCVRCGDKDRMGTTCTKIKPQAPATAGERAARLDDADIDTIAESMPGGLGSFMKQWGWRQFARAIEDEVLLNVSRASQAPSGQSFQARVRPWMLECFGPTIAADRIERNHRFLEEALELVQSLGCTASEAHQLVDYTFGRPIGEPIQEVGGVMVTLAALCLASELDMHAAGETELARISEPATVLKIRAKQAAKPKHSPLPQAVTTRAPYEWRDTGPLETNEGGAA